MKEVVNLRKLLWPTPLAILAAAVLNLVWYFLAAVMFPESVAAARGAANPVSTVVATVAYWVVGVILFVVLARFSKKPITHFTWLAILALIVSFAFPVMAANAPLPGGATLDLTMIFVLIVMHMIAAGAALPFVLKWVRE